MGARAKSPLMLMFMWVSGSAPTLLKITLSIELPVPTGSFKNGRR